MRAACADAEIMFGNNSTNCSSAIAAGKNVRLVRVSRQGKGNVVRAMLGRVEADVYVQALLDSTSDIVVGARLGSREAGPSASSEAPA
jgi:hypothetical protein